MIDKMTGPEHLRESLKELCDAFEGDAPPEMSRQDQLMERAVTLLSSLVSGVHAQTAALVMLAEATGDGLYEMDAWRDVIPRPPLRKKEDEGS